MRKEIVEIDIHNLDVRLEQAKDRILNDKKISERNKQLIFEYDEFLKRKMLLKNHSESKPHRDKNLNVLRAIAVMLGKKDFDKAERKDFEQLVNAVQARKDWGVYWKYYTLKMVKTFHYWVKNKDEPDETKHTKPQETYWIKQTEPKNPPLNPNTLPTIEEIKAMADSSGNKRDKAMIKTLWEGGLRIGCPGFRKNGSGGFALAACLILSCWRCRMAEKPVFPLFRDGITSNVYGGTKLKPVSNPLTTPLSTQRADDLVAAGGILNTPARLGILKALVPGDKVLPSFDYRLGVSQKEARRHCKVLEEHKLIRRYRRKAWGVSKEKQEYAYSLTELGRACLEYYGVVL